MSSVQTLLSVPPQARGTDWLCKMLTCAVKLEHATIPPYLCALWSIKDRTHPVYQRILRPIVLEEMGHMGLACNMLVALGGPTPMKDKGFVPDYPSRLPCDVEPKPAPHLVVPLGKLTEPRVENVFMNIEYPENDPIPIPKEEAVWALPPFNSIGAFYSAIRSVFAAMPAGTSFPTDKQIAYKVSKYSEILLIKNPCNAINAIDKIREQGEGTPKTPDASDFDEELAHYYQFEQIKDRRFYKQNPATKKWSQTGDPIQMPDVYDMADVPAGGWLNPSQAVAKAVADFNDEYKGLLDTLQTVWETGGKAGQDLMDKVALKTMKDLSMKAVALMKTPIPGTNEYYGPTFRVVR